MSRIRVETELAAPPVSLGDDLYTPPQNLPFTFNFPGGLAATSVVIDNNGRVMSDGTAFFPDEDDHTCNNWTSSSDGSASVGHFDRQGGGNTSWNAAHHSRSCSQEDLRATGGDGLFYCFAAD